MKEEHPKPHKMYHIPAVIHEGQKVLRIKESLEVVYGKTQKAPTVIHEGGIKKEHQQRHLRHL